MTAMTTPDATPCAAFTLDGRAVPLQPGDTVLQAASRAGLSLPHLCWHPDVTPSGSCRVCVVQVDGRPAAACTTRAAPGQCVESDTAPLRQQRQRLLQMLFVEGNHYCPGCEKSGNCLLQDQAVRAGMTDLHFEAINPVRPIDASHPDVLIDFDRCILCQLCVRASAELDGKQVFAIGGHGLGSHLVIDSASGRLGDSALAATDRAASICPVGALLPRGRGFAVPIGARRHDPPETQP
jgi:[NiFe] hydrogenase diaphorase moiety small subunit